MIGIDIVKNERIKEAVERFGERFLKRIYTEREINYCKKQRAFYECLAGRWACKEAVIKAVYQRFGVLLKFSEIEVLGEMGKPAKVNILREGLDQVKVLVSISHERDYSVGVAILA